MAVRDGDDGRHPGVHLESIFIGLLGSAFGVALGAAGAWYLQTYGVTLAEDVVAPALA